MTNYPRVILAIVDLTSDDDNDAEMPGEPENIVEMHEVRVCESEIIVGLRERVLNWLEDISEGSFHCGSVNNSDIEDDIDMDEISMPPTPSPPPFMQYPDVAVRADSIPPTPPPPPFIQFPAAAVRADQPEGEDTADTDNTPDIFEFRQPVDSDMRLQQQAVVRLENINVAANVEIIAALLDSDTSTVDFPLESVLQAARMNANNSGEDNEADEVIPPSEHSDPLFMDADEYIDFESYYNDRNQPSPSTISGRHTTRMQAEVQQQPEPSQPEPSQPEPSQPGPSGLVRNEHDERAKEAFLKCSICFTYVYNVQYKMWWCGHKTCIKCFKKMFKRKEVALCAFCQKEIHVNLCIDSYM